MYGNAPYLGGPMALGLMHDYVIRANFTSKPRL